MICDALVNWHIQTVWLVIVIFGLLPVASASSDQSAFPDIPFQVFNSFIQDHFNSGISLTTVLTILFTLTNNPDILNLHARQQHPKVKGETSQKTSGWIKSLANALQDRLADSADHLFKTRDEKSQLNHDQVITHIGVKLDGFAKLLKLDPYSKHGQFQGKLKPVSEQDIEPVHIICPESSECETVECQSHAILKSTRERDSPKVTLIKGTKIYDNVPVLSGQCPTCLTGYHADHERFQKPDKTWTKLYLNSAKYLKVGQNIWVDRVFSRAVLNGTYHFHASTSAFAEFWNTSFWASQVTVSRKVSRRQIWHAFVEESVRIVAAEAGFDLQLADKLAIDDITKYSFNLLGEGGKIRSAEGHSCPDCTHEYKAQADMLPEADDPAGLVGVDENHEVPHFEGQYEDANMEVDVIAEDENVAMDIDIPQGGQYQTPGSTQQHTEQNQGQGYVQMVVLDGIVMGPKHCSIEGCTADLQNYRNGVFCEEHEFTQGHLCRIQDCQNLKAENIQTCNQHRQHWRAHLIRYGRSTPLGIRRIVRRTEDERLPWLPALHNHNLQPHDLQPIPVPRYRNRPKTYFVASRFYCVETICAPCGVVIGWGKFAKAESPSNILDFLDKIYPDINTRPDYVCIDKGCQLLRHAVASGRWDGWKDTTRFIVDSYHYINHHTTDYLCRKYCNPAPLNGSAPNLVAVETDKFGIPHFKRAFNTQASLHI
jgi:CxC5 like cysteine cluster associated with KDZ transposases/CxC6 like cysteine cluster associated with KDZ transposases